MQKHGIYSRPGQRWWSIYKEDPSTFFQIKPRGNTKKLEDEHKDFLVELYGKDRGATIDDAIDTLSAKFEGVKIGKTAVHNFVKDDMNFIFKRVAFHA